MPKLGDIRPESVAPTPGTSDLSLPKESLIRATAEYAQCYAQGRRLHTRHFLLFVAPPAEGDVGVRLGTAVSRKTGHAVVRNRIKRIVRESFRLHIRHLPVSARVVVVAKRHAGSAALGLEEVSAELTDSLKKYFRLDTGSE